MLVSALRTPLASTLSPNTGLGLVVFYWGAFRSPLFQNLGCRSRKPAASCTPLEQGPPCASDPVAAAEGRPSRPDQQGGRLLAGQALTNAMRTRVPSACLHTDLCSESTRFHTWLWDIRQAEPRSLPQRFAPPGRWPQSWQSPNARRHPHCTAPHSLSHTVAPRPASQTPVATDLLSFLPLSRFQNVVHKWAAFRPLWLQAQLRSRGCHLRGLWDWLSHSLSLSLCTSVLVVLCVSSLFLPVVAWVWTVHRGSAGSLPKGAGLFPVWGCRAWVCRPAWTEVLVSQGGLTPPPRPAAAQSSCAV